MEIEFAITKEIINESLPLHYRHTTFKQRFMPYMYLVILLVIGLIQAFTSKEEGLARWLQLIFLVIIGSAYAFWYNYQRNNAGKKMLRFYGENTHYKVDANDDGLTFYLSYSTSQSKWPAFPKAVIGKDIVLLYQQNLAMIIFHHTFFSNDDFSCFKTLVRNHMHEVKED